MGLAASSVLLARRLPLLLSLLLATSAVLSVLKRSVAWRRPLNFCSHRSDGRSKSARLRLEKRHNQGSRAILREQKETEELFARAAMWTPIAWLSILVCACGT